MKQMSYRVRHKFVTPGASSVMSRHATKGQIVVDLAESIEAIVIPGKQTSETILNVSLYNYAAMSSSTAQPGLVEMHLLNLVKAQVQNTVLSQALLTTK